MTDWFTGFYSWPESVLSLVGWQDLVEVFFVGMSILGQHFNAKREVRNFYFWAIGNLGALVLFSSMERWLTCFLYLYFLYKSLQGIRVKTRLEQLEKVSLSAKVSNA